MPRLSDDQQAERRRHLLDAAERCFVREGFHRTTMQQICAEAGVSAGALYLYFASKEALVTGIIERDRQEVARGFAAVETAADPLEALIALARHHFAEQPRERSIMTLMIWAEAGRDPAINAHCHGIEIEVRQHLTRCIARLDGAGERFDPAAIADLLLAIGDGLFKRRAIEPDHDREGSIRLLRSLLEAVIGGNLANIAPTRPMLEPVP